jgi:transposase
MGLGRTGTPISTGRGRPWRCHRTAVNGVLWVLRTGCPWRNLLGCHGPWQTVYSRFVRWRREGGGCVLVASAGTRQRHGSHRVERLCRGRNVRPCASTRSGSAAPDESAGRKGPFATFPGVALGRSRGGITTKIHLVTEGNGYPLAFVLTPGNTHDSKALEPALDAICVPNRRGRPRKRPDSLVADRGYSYQRCRHALRRRGRSNAIPERSDQRERRSQRPGRRPKFDRALYRERNRIERAINRVKGFRRVATR